MSADGGLSARHIELSFREENNPSAEREAAKQGFGRKMEVYFLSDPNRCDHTVGFKFGVDGGVLVILKVWPTPVSINKIRPNHDRRNRI